MYPKFNPSPPPPPIPPPPPPLQSWVLRWVIAYQKHKNFPLSPLQAGTTPLSLTASILLSHREFTGDKPETTHRFSFRIKASSFMSPYVTHR